VRKIDIWLRYLNLKKKSPYVTQKKEDDILIWWIFHKQNCPQFELFDESPQYYINFAFLFFLFFPVSFSSLSLFLVCHEYLGPWIISLVWALRPFGLGFQNMENPYMMNFHSIKISSYLSIMIFTITWIIYT
jgi:hypothetical protein